MQLSKRKLSGHYLPGEDIYLFTLRNTGLEITISNYGCIITSFKVKMQDGSWNDIVLGFDKLEDYFSEEYLTIYPYFGAVIGRYANRIKDGLFHIDGIPYILVKNRGTDHLHGGTIGFDKKAWVCEHYSERRLVLRYLSPDGEEGYPGNLDTTLTFELNDRNELAYSFKATTDKATPVNLTHHSYFNLNNGEGTIKGHKLMIPASRILEQDANLVVTGNEVAVENTGYDFRQSHEIGQSVQAGDYDQSFVLNSDRAHNGTNEILLAAEIYSAASSVKLQVYSGEPLVHFYTGRWIPEITGRHGTRYQPFSGLCIETQKHPNAINIPHFPDTLLRPGQVYYSKTVYKVTCPGNHGEVK